MKGEPGSQRTRDIIVGAVLATLLLATGLGIGFVLSNRSGAPEVLVLPTRMASATPAILVPTLTATTAGQASPTAAGEAPLVTSATAEPATQVPGTPLPTLPPDEIVRFRAQVDGILGYAAPSDDAGVAGAINANQEVLVAGRTADGLWWLVCCVGTTPVWVRLENGNLVLTSGDIGKVEVLQ